MSTFTVITVIVTSVTFKLSPNWWVMLQHSVPKISEISFTVKVGEGSSLKTAGPSKKEYLPS